mmetsp:Transcript_19864/g.28955  ORF Transcript_19864/g.28955 Transcript_19864/m.28955 type:complete len:239 (-) Transcript_19864:1469-2185(-)
MVRTRSSNYSFPSLPPRGAPSSSISNTSPTSDRFISSNPKYKDGETQATTTMRQHSAMRDITNEKDVSSIEYKRYEPKADYQKRSYQNDITNASKRIRVSNDAAIMSSASTRGGNGGSCFTSTYKSTEEPTTNDTTTTVKNEKSNLNSRRNGGNVFLSGVNLNCSDVDFLSLPDPPTPGQNETPASSSTTAAAANIAAMRKRRRRRQSSPIRAIRPLRDVTNENETLSHSERLNVPPH